jgi:hypothetical protein
MGGVLCVKKGQRQCCSSFTFTLICVAGIASLAVAETLKKEPPMRQLKEDQRVLVDDGSSPKGLVKEVIGGNHTSVGGTKQIVRQRRWIAR